MFYETEVWKPRGTNLQYLDHATVLLFSFNNANILFMFFCSYFVGSVNRVYYWQTWSDNTGRSTMDICTAVLACQYLRKSFQYLALCFLLVFVGVLIIHKKKFQSKSSTSTHGETQLKLHWQFQFWNNPQNNPKNHLLRVLVQFADHFMILLLPTKNIKDIYLFRIHVSKLWLGQK